MRGEFESRQLGELTDDIAEERGDLEAFGRDPVYGGGEQRLLRQSELEARRAPSGEPDSDSTVRSVWDTRPPDTRDFLILAIVAEPPAPGTAVFDFQVPEGLVGFLRGFRYLLHPVPATAGPLSFRTSLTLDGVVVPDYNDMGLGPVQDDFVPTFVIANQLQRIGATFRITGAFTAPATDLVFQFYGQFKLADGRPAKDQVGNTQGGPLRYSTPLIRQSRSKG